MTHLDTRRADSASDCTAASVAPVANAPVFANAATPEQAAALYDEQARKAAVIDAALETMGGDAAALPAMSVRSLDEMTRGGDWTLPRARIKLRQPSVVEPSVAAPSAAPPSED
ncbi:MAG: hypothetical protein K2X55_00460 [Burkholderiaceae bacterium]|nr:hypothetical protein [Burkholderiaceae bacterium]